MRRVVGSDGAELEWRQQLQSPWRSQLVEVVTLWETPRSCIRASLRHAFQEQFTPL